MRRTTKEDRGAHVARLVMSVDFYERGGAVIGVQREKSVKRFLSPPVELMKALEDYARRIYKAELAGRPVVAREPEPPEECPDCEMPRSLDCDLNGHRRLEDSA